MQPEIESLILEYKEQRDALKEMIVSLEAIRANIDKIFPDKLDARYMRFFEEKIKTTTELFKAILDMRKEISKSVKDEIEIRRKVDIEDDKSEMNAGDIYLLAERLDAMRKEQDQKISRAL
jgi:hypothetical protein